MTMATHEFTVHIPMPASHVQMANNGMYFALPYTRTTIGVWTVADASIKPLELEGHRRTLSALCFGHVAPPTLLCSAAEDYIIVWNIDRAFKSLDTGQQIRGQIIATTPGEVQYVSFSCDDVLVAACVERNILVLDSRQEKTVAILEGHTSRVNCAEFCPHYSATLVSAADDRTFKVWDISQGAMVYQSSIISSSPFLCIAMNLVQENFAIGTSDGQVRIYDLTDGNGFRCLHQFDVTKLQQKVTEAKEEQKSITSPTSTDPVVISSNPSWKRPENSVGGNSEQVDSPSGDGTEVEVSILHMLYSSTQSQASEVSTPAHLSFLSRNNTLVSDILQSGPMLSIATTSCVVQCNARTMEACSFFDLQDAVETSSLLEESSKVLSWAGNAVLAEDYNKNALRCLLGSCFQNEVHLVNLNRPTEESSKALKQQLLSGKPSLTTSQEESTSSHLCDTPSSDGAANSVQSSQANETVLSVLSSTPLCENSPLKSELVLKEKTPKKSSKSSGVLTVSRHTTPGLVAKKTGEIVDNQPIVFKTKVKSSGYGSEEPRRVMFQPKTNATKNMNSPQKSKSVNVISSLVKEYPISSAPPTNPRGKIDVAERPTAVNCVKFSSDGGQCACALGNTSAQVFKMPLTGKGCAFTGHKGVVSKVHWSHDNKWLLTSSDDKTACLWSFGLPDPVMTFTTANNNFGIDREGGLKPDKTNPLFKKPVKFGQFYYVDKFILLTCGDSYHMYKYHLDSSKSDIKRYLSNNRYKVVQSFSMSAAQQITAFKAVNTFHSYVTLCGGSDKSIEVFDMNTAQNVRRIPEVHTKAVHAIAINEGSQYVSHPASAYDLFVTAAASDCIKLWDLRSSKCVRRYEGHNNRALPCGLAISPCSRFIASGSEDRSAYIFDIRAETYLHKLTGHTDVVSDVAFHPLHPVLVTGSIDGKLRTFSPL